MKQALGIIVQGAGWALVVASISWLVVAVLLLIVRIPVIVFFALERTPTTLIAVSFFAPVVLIPVAIRLVHGGAFLRRSAVRYGFCRRCGYDLRTQRKGDRCPECGTAV